MQTLNYLPIALGLCLLGCPIDQLDQPSDDDCAACEADDSEDSEEPTCGDECLEPGEPTWCTKTQGKTDQWVAIVGIQPDLNGGLVLLSLAADGTRELLTFSIDGAVVSTRKIIGEGTPRALASGPEGLYIITTIDNGTDDVDTSAIEHTTYDGDLLGTQPIDLDGLELTTAHHANGRLAAAGSLVLAGGSMDVWVGLLEATGGIAWQHTYDQAGLTDRAQAVAFDGTHVAIVGNVQPEESLPSDPFPPNQAYFAVHSALDGTVLHEEILAGNPTQGILEGRDIAKYDDTGWALTGTSTRGLLQSTWWTAIIDTDGVRRQQFEAAIGDNVTESIVTFGDDVIVGGRRGAPIPTASRVVRYTEQMSSLAWEWTAGMPADSHAEDLIRDMLVLDANLHVASIRNVHPPVGEGGTYTESLTVCSFRLD